MEIQKILFPRVGRCTEEKLYFRQDRKGRTQYLYNNQKIDFEKGGKVWFDTYFNGLSVEKWGKYARIENISLKLKISGKFRVLLIRKSKCEYIRKNNIGICFAIKAATGFHNSLYRWMQQGDVHLCTGSIGG